VFCKQVGLCHQKPAAPKVTHHAHHEKRAVQQGTCAVCQLVVTTVEAFLKSNATIDQIEQKLDQLCEALPSPYDAQCVDLVNTNLPQIIEWLEQNETPQAVCAQLDLCSSTLQRPLNTKVLRPRLALKKEKDPACSVCRLVVQLVEAHLRLNATLPELEAKLDQVCAGLPAPYNGQCVLTVATYLPQIVQWIEQNEDPKKVCAELGLC